MWDKEILWIPVGVWVVIAVVVPFGVLIIWSVGTSNIRIQEARPANTDHQILATEISRLHDDVRILQTQVGPKQ